MGANSSTTVKCRKSENQKVVKTTSSVEIIPNSESCDPFIHSTAIKDQEMNTDSHELSKCLVYSQENCQKEAEIRTNHEILMEQYKLMEKHYKVIEHENLVKEKLELAKVAFEIEKKKLQNEKETHERILREREFKLAKELRMVQNQSKHLVEREAIVDDLLKTVISFDIDRHFKTHRPIKPFDHHVKLPEINIENGSEVIEKRKPTTPQPIRRNQSFREFRRQNVREEKQNLMLHQEQRGFDQVLEHPSPLLSIQIPQHIKDEAAKLNVVKRLGQRSTKTDVNLSRRNTWNCGRYYQLNSKKDAKENREQIRHKYKCPQCEVWTSSISNAVTNPKCGDCDIVILPSTQEPLETVGNKLSGTNFKRRSNMRISKKTKNKTAENNKPAVIQKEDIYDCSD